MPKLIDDGISLEEGVASVYGGWRHLVEAVFALREPGVKVLQVKEKFGALRIYLSEESERMVTVLEQAELMSLKTCEICGEPGEPSGRSWIKTFCKFHTSERPS